MQKLIDEIILYIEYLKGSFGYAISMHYDDLQTVQINTLINGKLAYYNNHQNAYCMQIKRCSNLKSRCRECQLKTIKKLQINDGFFGTCHAGVSEFVFPIRFSNTTIGFISVSGYKTLKETPNEVVLLPEINDSQKAQLTSAYHDTLSDVIPNFEKLSAVINPLSRMMELFYEKVQSNSTEHSENPSAYHVYTRIVQYINENRGEDVSVEKLAEHLNCSRSYISHVFKKNNGNSIRHYCNSLRVADAKAILEQTRLSVTEIALMIGFSDPNYFTATFQSFCGMAPLAWRKTH